MSNKFKLLCLQGLCFVIMSDSNVIFNEYCDTFDVSEYWDITGTFRNECIRYDLFDSQICDNYSCEIMNMGSAFTRIINGKFKTVSLAYDYYYYGTSYCIVEYSSDLGNDWSTLSEIRGFGGPISSTTSVTMSYNYSNSDQFWLRFRSVNSDTCGFDNIMFNGVLVNETSVNEKSTTVSVTTISPTNNPTLIPSIPPTLIPSIPPTSIKRDINIITTTEVTSININNETESRTVNTTIYKNGSVSLKMLVFIIVLISGFCLSCGICTIFIIWYIIKDRFNSNKEIIDNIKWIHHNNKHSETHITIEPENIQNNIILKIPEIIPSPTTGDKPACINNEGSMNDSYKPGDTITFNDDKNKSIQLEGQIKVDSPELRIQSHIIPQTKSGNV